MKLAAPWLSQPEIKTLATAFSQAGFELRFVGGCVRDTLLGREFDEVDAASNATPEQAITLLEAANLRAIPTGIKHGTITALVGGKTFEITTLRSDVSTDGRHAEVAFTNSWEEDAKRRDFTMNALYLDMDGILYDYVNGLEDCKARHVKFIGDAALRIKEDYLRILRYFRFVASVGNNQFDDAALSACAANKAGIAQLSGERIAQELLKLLVAEETFPVLKKMQDAGILRAIFPAISIDVLCQQKLSSQVVPLLKLAALIGGEANLKSVAERLKLSGKQAKQLECWLSHSPLVSPAMSEIAQKKLVRKLGHEDYVAAVQLACALGNGEWKNYELLLAMASWQPPEFPITAADLMAQGATQGKALGDKLRELEIIWEEGGYKLTREELLIQLPR